MGIVGTRFEIDEWQNVQRVGKMWGKVKKVVEVPLRGPNGQPVLSNGKPVMVKTEVEVDAEVERKIPVHYGFHTRYPRIFDCYPEPDRLSIGTGQPTDCSWFIEDMGYRSMSEMCREVYVDPHDGATKPVYDFTELLHDSGKAAQARYEQIMQGKEGLEDGFGPLITPVRGWDQNSNYGRIDKQSVVNGDQPDVQGFEDQDKIWVVRMYVANELITVVNGKYLVQRVIDPWHVPRIPGRVECYNIDPELIYGQGILQPIEDELNELNDIHNLSMSSWIRIINKMVAVDISKIVSLEDFKPRAGGKIRIKDGGVQSAIAAIDQMDPTPSMLNQESNTRGMIEFISGNMDGSPGTRGTKQDHKTKGGLELISYNLNTRFATMYRQSLINEARRMDSMAAFFDQFAFEKMPYRLYRDDGSTALAEFNKDDIHTQGRGFEFAIEIDPNFGDTEAERQIALFSFDRGVQYEEIRRNARDPRMRQVNLDILFEKILRNLGHVDMTRVFTAPDNSMSPDDELQIIMQGGIVECKGDLMHHIETHILQRGAPNLLKAIEAGKAAPDTIQKLDLLIMQSTARLKTFVADPMLAAEKAKSRAMGPVEGMQ